MAAARRPGLTILVKLIAAFVVPAVLLFAGFGVVAHEVARRDLEAELGVRLSAVAGAAATHVRSRSLAQISPDGVANTAQESCGGRLRQVALATGVSRVYVFNPAFESVCDTRDDVPVGTRYYELERDRHELARVFGERRSVSSILFEGHDGALYKAGYAPAEVVGDDGQVALAVGVDAPAGYFERLADLRGTLVLYGVGFTAIVLLVSVVMAALITRPVRQLADAADRIGKGDLAAPIARPSRDEIGYLAATMDEMRRGLQARDERLQLMLSGIAHEVRNPLGGIELFAGILRDELPADSELRVHVARIEKELRYLKVVVADFLEYARRPPPELGPVEVGELAAEVIELVRPDAAAAGVELGCDAGGVTCLADAGQLRRALLNLMRNAVQAAGAAGDGQRAAGITARVDGDRAAIEVWNRGAPIPDDVRAKMFDPFFTTKEKGTGLGLAFVREIAVDHGGTIDVISDGDRGTTFALRLPRPAGRAG
jgi:signal transduction histidine kinase